MYIFNFFFSENSRSEAVNDGVLMENRSLAMPHNESSSSPCNRSLDSGFSDSERSNSPEIYIDGTPRQRRRRRRMLTREGPLLPQRLHDRLSSLWKDTERPPNPAHTSTPKVEQQSRRVNCRIKPKKISWMRSASSPVERQR